jgi:hypothetical protein
MTLVGSFQEELRVLSNSKRGQARKEHLAEKDGI